MPEEWRRFAAKNRSPILPGVRIFPGHLTVHPDSPCHWLMEHRRPPPLDSAALSPELHSTQNCRSMFQSRVSRVVIDHHDLFLAPGFAKRRAIAVPFAQLRQNRSVLTNVGATPRRGVCIIRSRVSQTAHSAVARSKAFSYVIADFFALLFSFLAFLLFF